MFLDKIAVIAGSVVGILFTFWFFLLKKEKMYAAKGEVAITISGGYSPDTISVPVGKTTKLILTRKDPGECYEDIVLTDFKIHKFLPMNKPVSIEITPKKAGTYDIVCGMRMFHGKIIAQ